MKWIVILAVLLSMHSNAQKQSLCYEISNEKLGIERSYLFGTMHAMEKNSFFFPKRITKLLEKSDALCLEIKNITEVYNCVYTVESVFPIGKVTSRTIQILVDMVRSNIYSSD